MILVVDASAAYELLTEGRCTASMVGAQDIIAPDLIVCELLNARWKVMRSGDKAPRLETILEFLERLRIMPSLLYAAQAAALAERLDHPVYDCFYVATAQREHAKLLTVDERLIRKLRSKTLARLLR